MNNHHDGANERRGDAAQGEDVQQGRHFDHRDHLEQPPVDVGGPVHQVGVDVLAEWPDHPIQQFNAPGPARHGRDRWNNLDANGRRRETRYRRERRFRRAAERAQVEAAIAEMQGEPANVMEVMQKQA